MYLPWSGFAGARPDLGMAGLPTPVPTGWSVRKETSMTWIVLRLVAATTVVLISGPIVAATGEELAEVTGLGQTFVGVAFVAAATSAPELVAAPPRSGSVLTIWPSATCSGATPSTWPFCCRWISPIPPALCWRRWVRIRPWRAWGPSFSWPWPASSTCRDADLQPRARRDPCPGCLCRGDGGGGVCLSTKGASGRIGVARPGAG